MAMHALSPIGPDSGSLMQCRFPTQMLSFLLPHARKSCSTLSGRYLQHPQIRSLAFTIAGVTILGAGGTANSILRLGYQGVKVHLHLM
jgi:hypothetical protein